MENVSDPVTGVSILLVEDEEATLELLTLILPKKFPEAMLHTAMNGRTGLELFRTYTPDIVITDINMPEMDGVEMVDRIRAIKSDTKFIVVTGKSEKNILNNSVAGGSVFDHFIAKPVVFQELFTAIEQCLGEIAQHV